MQKKSALPAIGGVCVVIAFALLVWPTLYKKYEIPNQYFIFTPGISRIHLNRITGASAIQGAKGGWYVINTVKEYSASDEKPGELSLSVRPNGDIQIYQFLVPSSLQETLTKEAMEANAKK